MPPRTMKCPRCSESSRECTTETCVFKGYLDPEDQIQWHDISEVYCETYIDLVAKLSPPEYRIEALDNLWVEARQRLDYPLFGTTGQNASGQNTPAAPLGHPTYAYPTPPPGQNTPAPPPVHPASDPSYPANSYPTSASVYDGHAPASASQAEKGRRSGEW